MQYLITAYDGTDSEASNRRSAARPAHIAKVEELRKSGNFLYAAAILDDQEAMIGSVIICSFPSKNELDDWLQSEPYVTGNVWEKIDVKPCRVGQSFLTSQR